MNTSDKNKSSNQFNEVMIIFQTKYWFDIGFDISVLF